MKAHSWIGRELAITIAIASGAAGATAAFEDEIYRTPYRVIDVHSHGALPQARVLQAQFEVLDATGVDCVNLVLFDPAGFPFKGGWSEENLRAWLDLRRQHPERLNVFGTVDFGRVAKEPAFFQTIAGEIAAAAKAGMQGLKIWKNLGMHHRDGTGALLRVDDPRLDPLWEKCADLGLPVLIHTADPKDYWYPNTFQTFHYKVGNTSRYHQHPDIPTWEELIRQRNHVVAKHPRTTFIGAHFASLTSDFDALAALLDQHPNLHVECGARLRFFYRYHPQAIRDFFIKYQDRILFGTDAFFVQSEATLDDPKAHKVWKERMTRFYSRYFEYFETDHLVPEPAGFEAQWMRLKGISLPTAVLEKFYHRNAERLIPGQRRGSSTESTGKPAPAATR